MAIAEGLSKSPAARLVAERAVMVLVLGLSSAWVMAQDTPDAFSEARAFLDQIAGEWAGSTAAVLGPGQEPVRRESTARARMVGNWLVAEGTITDSEGRAMTSILTIGYDAVDDAFVATYIDQMQRHMWRLKGSLDEAGATLTLDTEGPLMGDPTRLAPFRVVIQSHEPGRKMMRSMVLAPDGEWFEFSRAEHSRIE
jgi:hypothetical protein